MLTFGVTTMVPEGAGGGANCELVHYVIEYWNGSSWQYYTTVGVEVCD